MYFIGSRICQNFSKARGSAGNTAPSRIIVRMKNAVKLQLNKLVIIRKTAIRISVLVKSNNRSNGASFISFHIYIH
jgi:hypothetical protein